MLPDFNKTKAVIRKSFNFFVKERVKQYSQLPLTDENYKIVHEGTGMLVNYEENESHYSPLKKISSELSADIDALLLNPLSIFEQFDKLAKELAAQQAALFFQGISEITEKFNQTTQHTGDPTPEDLLKMYRQVNITFTDEGNPNLPTIFAGTDMSERLKPVLQELFNNEEYRRQFEGIINDKKRQWLDRENNRKLVD